MRERPRRPRPRAPSRDGISGKPSDSIMSDTPSRVRYPTCRRWIYHNISLRSYVSMSLQCHNIGKCPTLIL
jgi:hypothetical protein